jgi:predicted nucleic acid-binding protein
VCSALLRVEAVRACARYGDDYVRQALAGLAAVALLPVDDDVLTRAASLTPAGLRTLDSIHLATALTVRDDIGVVIAYDERLAEAAAAHGLPVIAPA